MVSYAEASVVPPEPLPLGGYTARGKSLFSPGGDDLKVRCLTLKKGDTTIALVNLEQLTVPKSLYQWVRSRIPATTSLWMGATHTHCAPDSQMLNSSMVFEVPGIAKFDRVWLDWYGNRITACIQEALAGLEKKPVRVQDGSVHVSTLFENRGRRRLATPIRTLTQWRGGDLPLWTTYGAHATIFGEDRLALSGDWPGRAMQMGGGLVFPGAIGDISPIGQGPTLEARVQDLAERVNHVGPEFLRIKTEDQLRFASAPIDLGPPVPHPTFAQVNKVTPGLAAMAVRAFTPTKAEIAAVRWGGSVMVGVPGEPSADLGRRIELDGRNLGFKHVVVVSHVNDWIGYILMPDDYDRGGYEATLCFHGREAATRVRQAALAAMMNLARRRSDGGSARRLEWQSSQTGLRAHPNRPHANSAALPHSVAGFSFR